MMETASYFAEERETYHARRRIAEAEIKAIDEALAAIDRLEAKHNDAQGKPLLQVEPARKPRADVRALTLAWFALEREPVASGDVYLIAHEIHRKPSEVKRALARLVTSGQITLSPEGFYQRAAQRSAAE